MAIIIDQDGNPFTDLARLEPLIHKIKFETFEAPITKIIYRIGSISIEWDANV